ncbi:MAG: betaine-aldehyde dehydrogenase, partial [Nocardioidaceae bacterium]|nr:betaine-aldehyde dehydrogenase [Nocardioidaceae bacterium]
MSTLFIDGVWQSAIGGAVREIHCPADGSLVATVPEAGPEDAEQAIEAARRAFDSGPWPATTSLERGALLHRVADLLERDKEEVARLESLDTGKRIIESRYDVDDIVGVFRHFAGLAGAESGRVVDTGRPGVVSRVVHEPVGVCSLIT